MIARVSIALAGLLLAGCSAGPRPIRYGEDECAHCRMRIMDARYGAEAVTTRGRQLPMDSVECLVRWIEAGAEPARSLWVTDFRQPNRLIAAESAAYLLSEHLPSPMGAGLTAFATRAAAETSARDYAGRVLNWPDLPSVLRDN
jgi:copper chaperone NosL